MFDRESHFYKDGENAFLEIYHNEDAISGDQFVTVSFTSELLCNAVQRAATIANPDEKASAVFDIISSEGDVYLDDIGTKGYSDARDMFLTNPYAVGTGVDTLNKLLQQA